MSHLTGAQVRMARGHLKLSTTQLAALAKVGRSTVVRIEDHDGVPPVTEGNLLLVQKALEAAGVEFIPENGGGAGVRLRKGEGL